VDAPVAPARILGRQPQNQATDLARDRGPARATRIGPTADDELTVQRNNVAGVTKNLDHRGRGSSLDNAANTARSAGSRSGRVICRRSTAT
jgi:hypothetical protein